MNVFGAIFFIRRPIRIRNDPIVLVGYPADTSSKYSTLHWPSFGVQLQEGARNDSDCQQQLGAWTD